ncbi:MAG: WD40/YVTN/BNR-like repeat-containing protein [Thermoanaerobaculia bacterium]
MNRAVAIRRSLAALVVATGIAASGQADSLPLRAETELRPAPLFGADIRSLAFDPSAPDRLLAGSSAGHVYRSDDGGLTWRNAGIEVPFAGWVVGTLVFDPDRPSRLWAGLWGIWGGGMAAVSDDLGATWEPRPLGDFAADQLYALAPVPGSPGHLVAGTRAGVLLSDDEGRSWRASGRDVDGLIHVSSLLVDRERPSTILAGTWRRAYRSDDGGRTWRAIHEGMVLDTDVFSMHPIPGERGGLWASSCGWVYRGERWGERWQRHQNGLTERRTPSFAVLSPTRLLAGTVAGSFLSTDGGESFRRTSPESLSVLAIAQHPTRPERVVLGTEGSGIWLSSDGGESFAQRSVGLRNVRVPALARLGDEVFVALAHAGPASGVFRSPDAGVSFAPVPEPLPTVLDLAVLDGRLFAATERGLFERVSGHWQQQSDVGDLRFEQLSGSGSRGLARSAKSLFSADLAVTRPRWQELPLSIAPPSAVSEDAEALWLLSGDSLFRLPFGERQEKPVPIGLPYRGGRLLDGRGDLVYFGPEGTYLRRGLEGAWTPVVPGRSRAFATQDPRYSFVSIREESPIAGASSAEVYDATRGSLRALETPFPAREILSALVVGDRLFLGTSGFGLWETLLVD